MKINKNILISILMIFILGVIPLAKPPIYLMTLFLTMFMYIALCESWNLIGGYTGYLSFGHAAFFGVGGYTTAILMINYGLSPFLTAGIGGILAVILALIVGYPCLRLKGPYFAVVTLCFAWVIQIVFLNLNFTGGNVGLWLPLMKHDIFVTRAIFYEAMLILMIIVVLFTIHIERSKLGAGLRAIREDEDVAQTLGINTTKLKLIAFGLSAFFPGIIGGIYSYYITFIHPSSMFDPTLSIILVLMALFGGRGTWQGPIIGAGTITIINELLTSFIGAEIARIIYALLFIGVVVFMPTGIMASIKGFMKKRKKASKN